MDNITVLEGPDLEHLLYILGIEPMWSPAYRLRIWQAPDGSVVKIKANEGTWTPALGERDER